MTQGQIVERVVRHVCEEIVADGNDAVVAEVRTAKSDMGRVIGRRGRVARAIRAVGAAAGDEEGLVVDVDFLD